MERRIKWEMGSGYITVNYNGNKDGEIVISSDPNENWEKRTQQIRVTSSHNPSLFRTITIHQLGIDIIYGGIASTKETEYLGNIDGGNVIEGESSTGNLDCSGAF